MGNAYCQGHYFFLDYTDVDKACQKVRVLNLRIIRIFRRPSVARTGLETVINPRRISARRAGHGI